MTPATRARLRAARRKTEANRPPTLTLTPARMAAARRAGLVIVEAPGKEASALASRLAVAAQTAAAGSYGRAR